MSNPFTILFKQLPISQYGFIGILLLFFAFTSCTSKKNLVYMQPLQEQTAYTLPKKVGYKLQDGDNLYIQVTAIDPTVNTLFTMGTGGQTNVSASSMEINGWIVDKNGQIDYPLLGTLTVEGLEVAELQDILQEKIDSIAPQATVNVKLVNRYITILGEVGSPGKIAIARNHLSVYEAIGMAGEINSFGDRKKVTIVRTVGGEKQIKQIDLTDGNLLASNDQYIHPNDIIYVEPIGHGFGKQASNLTLVLGIVSSLIALVSIFF